MQQPDTADNAHPKVRAAVLGDVEAVCAFGERVLPAHYAPLIGLDAARSQLDSWWTPAQIEAAVAQDELVVADADSQIVGVAQRGLWGADHVLWKLYLDPDYRGHGLGVALIAAIIDQLPTGTESLWTEHFASNVRAAAFYERQGFGVQRIDSSEQNAALDVVWRSKSL